MIMTPHATALSQQAEILFGALVALGPGWHGRREIAQQLNRRKLQTADGLALDWLVMQGRVEAERHAIDAPIRERWEYRLKE